MYAQQENGAYQWLTDLPTQAAVDALSQRLLLIEAHSDPNEDERAVKLAGIREARIRLDPASTDADISAAKEARKLAEMTALLNDEDMQRRIADEDNRLAAAAPVQSATAPAAPVGVPPAETIWLDVPFKEKDAVKQAAGLLPDGRSAIAWDKGAKRWYARPGADLDKIKQWLPGEPIQAVAPLASAAPPATENTWLAVPYEQRSAVKALAGLLPDGRSAIAWDKAAKCWYARPGADLDRLQPWVAQNSDARQEPAMTPEQEFGEALKSVGCILDADPKVRHPIMDGDPPSHRDSGRQERRARRFLRRPPGRPPCRLRQEQSHRH